MWTPNMQEPEYLVQAKLIVTDGWSDLSGIEQHHKTLTEWQDFAATEKLNWRTPDSVSVQIFLGSFRSKGPTVPKRKLDSLRWLQDNIGLHSGADLDRVKKFCHTPQSHLAHQAKPAHFILLLLLENAMSYSNIFIASLAAFATMIVTSVLRPRHLQRSVIEIVDNVVQGICYRGKARFQGVQRPFKWAAASYGFSGVPLAVPIARIINISRAASGGRTWLLPDFHPKRSDWSNATTFEDYPMPLAKVRRLITI